MRLMEATPQETAHESGGYVKGVAVALVTQNKDDDSLCRVKVRYPWYDKPRESYWARLASPMARRQSRRGLHSGSGRRSPGRVRARRCSFSLRARSALERQGEIAASSTMTARTTSG